MKYVVFLFIILCLNSCKDNSGDNEKFIKESSVTKGEDIWQKCDDISYSDEKLALENKDCVQIFVSRNQGYTKIPEFVFSFSNLEKLDLGMNSITEIPNVISGFKFLKELSLSYNYIQTISDSISNIKTLEKIELLENEIEIIPLSLCKLENLKFINLTQNKIIDIPNCLVKLSNLEAIGIGFDDDKYRIPKDRINELKRISQKCKIYPYEYGFEYFKDN